MLKKILSVARLVALSLLVTLFACETEETQPLKGEVKFSLNGQGLSGGRTKTNPHAMKVTIKDADGNVVHNQKTLEVFQFGDEYISEPVALSPGNYTLTEFLIVDASNVVILATPLEGSNLAHLVDDPAPIAFSVTKDNTTNVPPEVVAVGENPAADFGYVAFSLNEVPVFSFATSVFIYNTSASTLELASAHLEITAATNVVYSRDLQNITNTVLIRDGLASYEVKVTKTGYLPFEKTFTETELKSFSTDGPLTIVLMPESLSDGLVAWYPFNGNAQDVSGNDFHGVVTSATLADDKDGAPSTSYQFNGSGYIQIPGNDLMLEEFTYSMWISPTATLSAGTASCMFSVGDEITSYHQVLSMANQYGGANFTGLAAGGWIQSPTGPTVATVTTNTLPTTNQWDHIVWVRNPTSTTMYLNNVLIGSVPNNNYTPIYGSPTIALIGMRCNFTQGFIGKIDDFRIYNRSLSAGEVGALFHY